MFTLIRLTEWWFSRSFRKGGTHGLKRELLRPSLFVPYLLLIVINLSAWVFFLVNDMPLTKDLDNPRSTLLFILTIIEILSLSFSFLRFTEGNSYTLWDFIPNVWKKFWNWVDKDAGYD